MPDPAQPMGADGFPPSGWTPPAGSAPATPAPSPAPAASTPAAPDGPKRAPAVRDLSGRPLSEVYDLQWPKEVDGVEIRQVVLKRMSTGEVAAFVDRVRAGREEPGGRFPLLHRVDGALLTDDEWNALDPDDSDALGEKGERFLPARFRAARVGDSSSPTAPATTGSSSDGSQASA